MPPYGVITFIAYVVLIPLQNWVLKKKRGWSILLETIYISIFNVIVLIGSFIYYKSGVINGEYSFWVFTFEVYFPIFFIVLGVLILFRWFIFTDKPIAEKKITLTGDNKLDVLHIRMEDLIGISSADNYVEVNYLKDDQLEKKLLRNTLKNVHNDLPQLIKVHRSHLVNPVHIVEWKSSNTLRLTHMDVPVTKNYKEDVLITMSRP